MVYTVTDFIIIWYYNICKCREFLNRRSQTLSFEKETDILTLSCFDRVAKLDSGVFFRVRISKSCYAKSKIFT
jgi:hypothetical protein